MLHNLIQDVPNTTHIGILKVGTIQNDYTIRTHEMKAKNISFVCLVEVLRYIVHVLATYI